jgi:hypothetical protein
LGFPIDVGPDDKLTITEGGSVRSTSDGPVIRVRGGTVSISGGSVSAGINRSIEVDAGTLTISGGTVSANTHAIGVFGGTATISGGSLISTNAAAIYVGGGMVNLSGGSLSWREYGVARYGGAVNIYGCLTLTADGYLTGSLLDGRRISTPTVGISESNLIRTCAAAYEWSGFLPPVKTDDSSVFKLGRTVSVKFALTGASAGIANAVARLWVSKWSDDVTGTEEETGSTVAATSGNLFRYDSSGVYVYNLGTSGLTPGTYELRVDLGDGDVTRTVKISLR